MFFSFDAEAFAEGTTLANPPFCGWQCGAGGAGAIQGYIGAAGGAPQGSKYFYWDVTQNQHDFYNELRPRSGLPMTGNKSGQSFYLAYRFRFDRKTGGNRFDVFESGNLQSAEKGVEIRGAGLRWITAMGQWDSLAANQSGRFTVWLGNPSFHLNANLEHNDVYYPNQNGFSNARSQQLDYERWHAVVLSLKLSTTTSGAAVLWVDGIKTADYQNILTVAPGTAELNIEYLELGGTLCQPAYDCPPHTRKYDALILTDNWQDVQNGGYLATGSGNQMASPTRLRLLN